VSDHVDARLWVGRQLFRRGVQAVLARGRQPGGAELEVHAAQHDAPLRRLRAGLQNGDPDSRHRPPPLVVGHGHLGVEHAWTAVRVRDARPLGRAAVSQLPVEARRPVGHRAQLGLERGVAAER